MRKEQAIVGTVIIAVIAIVAYFLLRKSKVLSAIDDKAAELKFYDKSLTDEEAKAAAAEAVALEALRVAQQAEKIAKVEEQAEKVRLIEEELARQQARAILLADEEAARIAEELEAAARVARIELEKRWTLALTTAESQMKVTEEAAKVATTSYLTARYNVETQIRIVELLESKLADAITELATHRVVLVFGAEVSTTLTEIHRLRDLIAYYKLNIPAAKDKLETLRHIETRTKTDAAKAISHANDCVERVLTIIADIRLLGILLALAGRVDAIAKATREKVAELERKLA